MTASTAGLFDECRVMPDGNWRVRCGTCGYVAYTATSEEGWRVLDMHQDRCRPAGAPAGPYEPASASTVAGA